MKYLARFGLAVSLSGVAAGCVPDFQFATEQAGPGGGGGAGGGAGGQGGAGDGAAGAGDGAAGAGAGGGEVLAAVPCGASGAECAPGQMCCFFERNFDCDHCSFSDNCATPSCSDGVFTFLRCNDEEDCTPDETCCVKIKALGIEVFPVESSCKASCAADELLACHINTDCGSAGSGAMCLSVGTYPGYKVCQ